MDTTAPAVTAAKTIAQLNDEFRTNIFKDFTGRNRIVVTPGITSLPLIDQLDICKAVSEFSLFTKCNDPHGEHDFGSIEHGRQKIFWKIDYYDLACEYGSEDPADPEQTTRVLTIMLASEY